MMSTFFKYFPLIKYTVTPPKATGERRQSTTIPNIFGGYVLPDRYKTNPVYYNLYTVGDGETPNTVAYKLYGSEEVAWTILLLNDMENFVEQWPLSNTQLENFVDEKYQTDKGGETSFLTVGFESSVPGFTSFVPGSFVDVVSGSSSTGRLFVLDWNPTYRRLVLGEGDSDESISVDALHTASSSFSLHVNDSTYFTGTILEGAADSIIIPRDTRSPIDGFFAGMQMVLRTSSPGTASSVTATITNYESGTGRISFTPKIMDALNPQPSGVIDSSVCSL